MRFIFLTLFLSLPLWVFDPAGKLSFRALQWGALFFVTGVLLLRRPKSWNSFPWLFLGFLPPLLSFALYRNGESLLALGAWAAFMVLIQLQRTHPQAHRHAQIAILLGAGVNLALLCLQALGYDPFFIIPQEVRDARIKGLGTADLTGFVGSASDLAILLLLSLPIADTFFREKRALRITALGLLAAGIVLTGSRLPLLLALIFFLAHLPLKLRWVPPALLLALVLVYPPLRYKTIAAVERGLVAQQVERRLTEWSVATDLFLAAPWLPRGFGNYGSLEAEQRFQASLPVGAYHGWFAQAHNDFLQSAVETGVVGLLFYALALVPIVLGIAHKATPPWSVALFLPLMLFHFPVRLAPAVFALAVGTQLPAVAKPWRWQRFLAVAPLAALSVGFGIVGLDWCAANHVFTPTPAVARLLPESRTKLDLEEAWDLSRSGQTVAAEARWNSVLAEQPHPAAAMSLAQSLLERREVAQAVTTVCRSYVVTGSPVLARWLYANRAHVSNLARRDQRLTACILDHAP